MMVAAEHRQVRGFGGAFRPGHGVVKVGTGALTDG
jgi:hypothetical protein